MPRCAFLGRSTLDLIYLVAGFPQENTKIFASEFIQQAGGPALNAAITFTQLGGSASLFSAIGDTTISGAIHDELATYKIAVHDIAAGTSFVPPVATAIVNAENGSRTCWNPPATDIPTSMAPIVLQEAPAPMVLIDGFLVPEFTNVLKCYADHGATICLDGGSWKPVTPSLLPICSIVICSEGFTPPGIGGAVHIIEFLHEKGVCKVAITRGQESILASDAGRRFEIEIEKVKAVDTLGAGDILHGAFCWYYLRSGNFREALAQAAHIASLSCQDLGARKWIERLTPQ